MATPDSRFLMTLLAAGAVWLWILVERLGL